MSDYDSFPAALPQVVLNGNSFYIRSGSLTMDETTKIYNDKISLTNKVRRLIGTKPRAWKFTVAMRSPDQRAIMESLLTETPSSYVFTFQDQNGSTYNVTVDEASPMTTVVDNTEYWDVNLTVVEWT